MPDFTAIQNAFNKANYATVIELLDEHFGDNPTLQYSTLKQTIEHVLMQGQQPNPATQQSLQMLINGLIKKNTAPLNEDESFNQEKREGEAGNSKPDTYTQTVNGVPIAMILVQSGTFNMGGTDTEAQDDEKTTQSVTLYTYYIGKYPVTQAQWRAVMNNNPSYFKGDNLPVERVSWEDALEFCHRLSIITGKNYRLPTEAEWEYAARGGQLSIEKKGHQAFKYAGSNNLPTVAWYDENSGNTTHPVGQKNPNELGLYDMSGNVWEWCNDWYAADYYKNSPAENPTGPTSGTYRVCRGGSWLNFAVICRVAFRLNDAPGYRFSYLGFRLAV